MAYCIYLRKSRADAEAEAHGEGETLARHEKTLLELAKSRHLNVTEIYREVVSGETIAARPVMQQLLSAVEQGVWEGVLVMEVERLARGDTIDQGVVAQTFKFSDTLIITPLKTYDPKDEFDEEYFEFGLFMARREYKMINRRLQRGRLASVKEGKYVGNRAPYGYRRVKLEYEKGYTLEIVPEEADVIRMIYNDYTIGEPQPDGTQKRLGVSLLVRRLNNLKIPTKTGGCWTVGTVRDILINPVYCGKVRWNWRHSVKKMLDGKLVITRPRASEGEWILANGLHPGIISEETFQLAQDLMSKNPPRPLGERYKLTNPLAGLIVCGKCGRRMVRRPYSNPAYQPSLMCTATSCHNVSSSLVLVEQRLLNSLAEWLSAYKLKWGLNTSGEDIHNIQIAQKRQAVKRLSGELTTLERQLDNVHDLLEQGIYTTEKFLERSRLLAKKIQDAKDHLTSLEAEIALETAREESRIHIIPKIEHLLRVYQDLPDARAKNDMLKDVLERAVYTKERSVRNGGSLDGFELVLYPRLPESVLSAEKSVKK